MKAAVINEFGGPEVIHMMDVEKPSPKRTEVLVKNSACSVGRPDSMVHSGHLSVPWQTSSDVNHRK